MTNDFSFTSQYENDSNYEEINCELNNDYYKRLFPKYVFMAKILIFQTHICSLISAE